MLDKKQIGAIFLFTLKMGCKAEETISTMHLAQELLTNVQCSGGSRSFAKETTALKMRSVVAGHRKLTTTESIMEADPLKITQEVAEELNVDHSTIIWHLKQIGKVKKLSKWVPQELTTNQKNYRFEVSSSLTLCNYNEPFLNWIVMLGKK